MSTSRKDLDPVFDAKRIKQIDEYERDAREGTFQPQEKKNNSANLGLFSEREQARIQAYYRDIPFSSTENATAPKV